MHVGKLPLLRTYVNNSLGSDVRDTSIGPDFDVKTIRIHDATVTLQIWDIRTYASAITL